MATDPKTTTPQPAPTAPGTPYAPPPPSREPPAKDPLTNKDVEEVDPRDRDPNLLHPEEAGDQLPGEPPGVHRRGDVPPEEMEKNTPKEEHKK
jgi:hypothetical protein